MSLDFSGQSMVDPIRRVVVRRPDASFAVDDPEAWNYSSRPDLDQARQEHDALVAILRRTGAEVLYHDLPQPGRADSIFVFDPLLMTDEGAVVLHMGKDLRRGEEDALAGYLEACGVPRRFSLVGSARAEGGDLLWIDQRTLAVGLGFRTNQEALRQLQAGLVGSGVDVFAVELPYHSGSRACLHLLSLISMVDHDLAVVYPKLLSVPFWQRLEERGIELVPVPDEEFATMGPNVLALAPRHCLMLEGNPITRQRLETRGCVVETYRGNEISLKAEGGPTCLTRPILRCEER